VYVIKLNKNVLYVFLLFFLSGILFSSVPIKPVYAASAEPRLKVAITTVFWVGEGASAENNFISNSASAWDSFWKEHYGGFDDPDDRCGYKPCGFEPKENPFYVALPYNEFTPTGMKKASAVLVPWYEKSKEQEPLLKNQWVKITHGGNVCYGQWEDVGPNEEDDFAYVFGSALLPKNRFGVWAGLDISPALRDCLDVQDVSLTLWGFVSEEMVPDGPWKDMITTSEVSW
jgi:hypothetical protein